MQILKRLTRYLRKSHNGPLVHELPLREDSRNSWVNLFMRPALVLLCLCLLPGFPVFAQNAADAETVPGTEIEGNINWDDADVFYAGEITVTGTRSEKRLADSPVATEIISAGEIENSSAATLSEALDDYGLMYSSNAMGDYIQLQGLGESRVLYLVDGRRVPGRVAEGSTEIPSPWITWNA
jgi:outer membrane receptor protein involved in Fe transport